MNQLNTTAIVLSRTDFGEADRILTLLTPDHGKLRLLAKGVRRVKSKLAGGIELFSVSTITYIRGRGEIGTLVSTRLVTHYGHIVTDIERTMVGYELIKQLNKITEDQPEPEYFELLHHAFAALDDTTIPLPIIRFWYAAQLLRIGGHAPNLQTDTDGQRLAVDRHYQFDFDAMAFAHAPERRQCNANHIKFLRLAFASKAPHVLAAVGDASALTTAVGPLVQTMFSNLLRL